MGAQYIQKIEIYQEWETGDPCAENVSFKWRMHLPCRINIKTCHEHRCRCLKTPIDPRVNAIRTGQRFTSKMRTTFLGRSARAQSSDSNLHCFFLQMLISPSTSRGKACNPSSFDSVGVGRFSSGGLFVLMKISFMDDIRNTKSLLCTRHWAWLFIKDKDNEWNVSLFPRAKDLKCYSLLGSD